MPAPIMTEKAVKDKTSHVVKVKKRRKSLLRYFRCMSCTCRKEEGHENNNVLLKKNQNADGPHSFSKDTEGDIRRQEEIKKERKLSDSYHVTNRLKAPSLATPLSVSLPDLRAPTYSVRVKPILKKDVTRSKPNGVKKKTHFSEEVDVYFSELNSVVKDHLKEPPETPLRDYTERPTASRDIINATRADRIFKLSCMDIERSASGRRYLRIVIKIDESSVRDRVTVCSARGGTRLVLTASTNEPLGDGTFYTRQLADKFRVPHPIDPCAIRAKVSTFGNLVIKADMFDFDEERSG